MKTFLVGCLAAILLTALAAFVFEAADVPMANYGSDTPVRLTGPDGDIEASRTSG